MNYKNENELGNLMYALNKRNYKYRYLGFYNQCSFMVVKWDGQLYFEDAIPITIDTNLNIHVHYWHEVTNSKLACPSVGVINVPYMYVYESDYENWADNLIEALKFVDRCYDHRVDADFKGTIKDGKVVLAEGTPLDYMKLPMRRNKK